MEKQSKRTEKKLRRKNAAGTAPKLLNIPRNWLHQGLFYMDRTEFCVRIFIEGTGIVCILLLLSYVFRASVSDWRLILISFATIHTLNWVLNGNWWAIMLFTFPGIRNAGEKASCQYLSRMAERLRTSQAISAVVIYGSVTRGKWHDKSDLDIRILREKGFLNGLVAAYIMMRERAIAFLYGQPIDMFLADSTVFLRKMREDENPIILLKRGDQAERSLSGKEEVLVDSWPVR